MTAGFLCSPRAVHNHPVGLDRGTKLLLEDVKMKSLIALVLTGSGMAVAQDAVQWRVEDGGNGHWYQLVVSGSIQWFDARDAASEAGGYLASSTSPNEESFLVDLANRNDNPQAWVDDFGGNALGPYLGAYQPVGADPSQPWAWVSGEPW